ncbi:MAG: SDR family NAD(P)-dependent oxidoreductase, partial [Hyphomicrobiales bacterium]
MNIDLKGKTAVVTGSTQGIGHAIAAGLARAGARVAINGRGKDKTDKAAKALARDVAGADVIALAGDVSTAEGCAALAKALPQVDILVNNAGIFDPADFFEIGDDEWLRFFGINVL